jgi:hypothetical protein
MPVCEALPWSVLKPRLPAFWLGKLQYWSLDNVRANFRVPSIEASTMVWADLKVLDKVGTAQ